MSQMRKQGNPVSGPSDQQQPPPQQANRRNVNIDSNIPSHFGPNPNLLRQPTPSHLPNGTASPNPINGAPHSNGNGTNPTPPEDPVANYTLQGVMQWLNGEYRRYERDRNAWEIERASLVVLFPAFSFRGVGF